MLFLMLGVVLPWRSMTSTPNALQGVVFSTRMKITLYWSNNVWLWFMTLLVIAAWYWHERAWSYLGFTMGQPTERAWPYIAALIFVLLYIADTLADILTHNKRDLTRERLHQDLGFLPANRWEFLHFIPVALTAGFCEELIFRAYFIRYFQQLLGAYDPTSSWSILLSAIIFGVIHAYQGWQAIIKVSSMAILFGYIFVHTGSIWLVAILHFGIDFMGGLLAWQLLRQRP